ncbi:MAG: radical SAM protein [bacterium]|nr:radical SAM protein [bacterium]
MIQTLEPTTLAAPRAGAPDQRVTPSHDAFAHLARRHPCFSQDGHHKPGRIHVPVSPLCNIQCRFCKRAFNKCEERPGVARGILTPQEAVDTVARALKLCPELAVVGIAGPGDPLASGHALETFRLVHARFPHLLCCVSTNGLLLDEHAAALAAAGVETVTVTVNAVHPRVLGKICANVMFQDKQLEGAEAATILIAAQLAGIRTAVALGLVVKINLVLIPGLNDEHVAEVARATAAAGASLINILPLIPQYELANYPVPTCDQLNAARAAAEEFLPVFRHCKHCRADACGIPGGKDFAGQLYDRQLETFSHG